MGGVREARRTLLVLGIAFTTLSVLLGWWIVARVDPFAVDTWWNGVVAGPPNPVILWFALAMNWVGGGWFGVLAVPIAGAIGLILLRRPWAAAFFIGAEAVSALGVQGLKQLFGRARPEDMLVVSDYGSFPSGHVANAATIAVAAALIFPRLWVMLAGAAWIVLMAFSRTYLHAHWLSDTVGGALVGAGVTLLVAAAFLVPLTRERPDARAHAPG